MAINKVNTTAEEQSFKFPKNQSSILYTADTNNITINGVNVIVDEPKRGDVMCITHYKTENGSPLPADQQKVIWIDGLSIEPTQLSQEYEPVGICFAVKGNKAFVRYREELENCKYATKYRFQLPYSSIMSDGVEHTLRVKIDDAYLATSLVITEHDSMSIRQFTDKLNTWFLVNSPDCSAELLRLDDSPSLDSTEYENETRLIVTTNHRGIQIEETTSGIIIKGIYAFANQIKAVSWSYLNNGFTRNYEGGCCRAMYYDCIQDYLDAPDAPMTNINTVPGWSENYPARLVDFTDNPYCQILRDNFANYDEYFDSMMLKYPCGAGGAITEFTSGKNDTYKLADCTYLDNETGKQEILYPAANWAASISLNAPKLGKGNWWLPSAAEMVQMMRDITYGTSFWQTEPDIVNRVITKLTSISNSGWSRLSAANLLWSSSKYSNNAMYNYAGDEYGSLQTQYFAQSMMHINASPITIYEF